MWKEPNLLISIKIFGVMQSFPWVRVQRWNFGQGKIAPVISHEGIEGEVVEE